MTYSSGAAQEAQEERRTSAIPAPFLHLSGYRGAAVAKACPDLVIWRTDRAIFRLVEVKCPHWDRPSREQEQFLAEARRRGIDARIVEWEFLDEPPGERGSQLPT